jgi:hypothetical protein
MRQKIVKRLHLGFIGQHKNSTNFKYASFVRLDFHHLLEKKLSNEVDLVKIQFLTLWNFTRFFPYHVLNNEVLAESKRLNWNQPIWRNKIWQMNFDKIISFWNVNVFWSERYKFNKVNGKSKMSVLVFSVYAKLIWGVQQILIT